MKNLMHILLAVAAAFALSACGTTKAELDHDSTMFDKQVNAQQKHTPTPIFALEAIDGQTITMSGVKSIRVYDPATVAKGAPTYTPRLSGSDQAWNRFTSTLGILVNPLTNLYIHKENQATAREQSRNNIEMQRVNMGTLGTVAVQGFQTIGEVAGQGLDATVEMGSKHITPASAAAPAEPAAEPAAPAE